MGSTSCINIVCYRYNPGNTSDVKLAEVNTKIMLRMQEPGVAAVSDTTVHGQHCLRVAINNPRTRRSDLEFRFDENVRIGHVLH